MKERKSHTMRVMIEPSVFQTFHDICDDKYLNASALIRQWVLQFIKENASTSNIMEESPKRAIVSA